MRPLNLSKPSKYRNRKTRMGGRTFDSKLEAERWLMLRDKEARGKITGLECQPSYYLHAWKPRAPKCYDAVCVYRPDFHYWENKHVVCEEVKGVETALWRLKAKIFRANYPTIELRIIKKKDVTT